jgi:hypothetical protein
MASQRRWPPSLSSPADHRRPCIATLSAPATQVARLVEHEPDRSYRAPRPRRGALPLRPPSCRAPALSTRPRLRRLRPVGLAPATARRRRWWRSDCSGAATPDGQRIARTASSTEAATTSALRLRLRIRPSSARDGQGCVPAAWSRPRRACVHRQTVARQGRPEKRRPCRRGLGISLRTGRATGMRSRRRSADVGVRVTGTGFGAMGRAGPPPAPSPGPGRHCRRCWPAGRPGPARRSQTDPAAPAGWASWSP